MPRRTARTVSDPPLPSPDASKDPKRKRSLFLTLALCSMGFFFWFILFSPYTKDHIYFWPMMCWFTLLMGITSWLTAHSQDHYYFRFRPNDAGNGVFVGVFM